MTPSRNFAASFSEKPFLPLIHPQRKATSATEKRLRIYGSFLKASEKRSRLTPICSGSYGAPTALIFHEYPRTELSVHGYSPAFVDGQYIFRIPRQIDNSLTVVLKKGDEIVDTLTLGEYIAKCGYDWSAEDLADIDITIDIPIQQVFVSVSGWNDIIVMDIVI